METSPDGVTWSALPTADYEIVNGQVIISTITNGMRYSVAFVPQTFTATVSATMPNNLSWTGASQQISSSGAISWSLNTATISPISYNSNLVVSIDTKTSGNPYILKYVTVNGAVYIPTDKGSGVYEVSIGSVKSDIAIEITFAETIKLTFDYSDPLFSLDPGNYFVLYDKDSKNPQAVEPSNNFYVEKGTSRMFSVFFGEDTSDLCVFELMVGSNLIPIQTLYETGRMDADTEVSINLDYWEHETTINYWGGSYRIGTVNLSPLILPSQAEMETLGYMKPGYNISGWTNVSGGTTPVYTPGAQITVTSSVEYWPVWSLSQYGITYDMNGGDLPVPGSNPDVFDINDAPFALAPPTRTGYGPGHWELPDGTAISFVDPTVHHWDLTLKAVWGSPNSYTVTLMDGTVIGTVSVTYGDNYHSLPILPAKSGYSFSGWSLDTEGTDRVVSLTVVNKGEDHNLYAVWAPTNTWIIELAGSNNQSGQFSAPSYVVKGNEALLVVIPNTGYGIDSIVLTGSGTYRLENDPAQYSFSGTNVTIPVPGCSEGSYMSFWVTPSEDIVIGAVLSPIEYTVTVGCVLCGTEALGHGQVYSYTIETSSWVVPVPTVPHTNSFFLGWSGTGITGVSGDPLIIQLGSAGDRTYSANWQMSTKAIQYFMPGGNLSDPVREYVPGGTVITFVTPVWTGYTFMGWYTDPGYVPGSEIYSTEGRTDVLNLYAKFQINQNTITFDSDGGSPVSSITQDYGTAVTAPAAPTKTGYTFAGWYPAVPATMPAGNVTIVAQWTVNQYTVSFDSSGGSSVSSITQDYGTTIVSPADPTRAGYYFAGWSPALPATMPAENMTLTATWKIKVDVPVAVSLIYNGFQQTGVIAGTGYTLSGNTGIDAGDYTATATLVDGYIWSDDSTAPKTVGWSIAPGTQTVSSEGYTGTYDGSAHTITVTQTGGTVTYGTVSGTYELAVAPAYTSVGDYTVYFKVVKANYEDYTGSAVVSITKATYDMTGIAWSAASFVYDGSEKAVTISGLPAGVTVSAYTGNTGTDAGTYYANATFAYDSANYNEPSVADHEWSIAPGTQTVSSEGYTGTYDGSAHTITVTQTGGTVTYGTVSGTYELAVAPAYTSVGDYTVYFKVVKANYEDYTGSATVKIYKAILTATYGGETVTYGNVPVLSVNVTGFVNGETAETAAGYAAPTTINTNVNAGTYTLNPSGGAADNYDFSYVAGDLIIQPKTVSVTPDALSKVYGDADPVFTYTLSETVAVTGALSREAGEDVGTYAMTLGDLSAGGNYTLSLVPTNFAITKVPLTIKADDKAMTFGGAEPEYTVTYTGFVNGETQTALAGTLSVTSGYDSGVYAPTAVITASGLTSANYAITYETGVLTVSKIQVDAPTAVTGLAYSGIQQTGVVAAAGYTLTGNTGTDAGDYTATATLVDGYIWSDDSTTEKIIVWSISQKEIIVIPDALSKIYGRSDPELTYTLSESVTVTGVLSRAAGEEIGIYTLYLGSLAPDNGNYKLALYEPAVTFTVISIHVQLVLDFNSAEFTGHPIEPAVTVKDIHGRILDPSSYGVFYYDNTNVGKARVDVVGVGNYDGVHGSAALTITPYVGNLTISFEPVNEAPTEPPVLVKSDLGVTLIRDVDYSVSYENNTSTGTATAIISGIGNYVGTTGTSHFEVTAYSLPNDLGHVIIKDKAADKVLGPEDTIYLGQKLVIVPSSQIEGNYAIYDWNGNRIDPDGEYIVEGPISGPFSVEGIAISDPENVGEWGSTLGISLIVLLLLLKYIRYRMRGGS